MFSTNKNTTESEIEKLQIAYLNKMLIIKEPYFITYDKYKIAILPNVFPPYIENQLIIDHVVFDANDSVLDICSGSGLLSIHAALNCKRVIATDINPDAIKNININAKSYNLENKIKAVETDTYPEKVGIKFDKIVSIPPFSNKKASSVVERSVWDDQHKTIKKIFAELKDYLTEAGSLYLVWSSISGFDVIFNLNNKYKYRIEEEASVNDELSVYKLFKISIS